MVRPLTRSESLRSQKFVDSSTSVFEGLERYEIGSDSLYAKRDEVSVTFSSEEKEEEKKEGERKRTSKVSEIIKSTSMGASFLHIT